MVTLEEFWKAESRKKSCEALHIARYELSKIYGARFLNHRRRTFARLINNWPGFTTASGHALAASKGYRWETSKACWIFEELQELCISLLCCWMLGCF